LGLVEERSHPQRSQNLVNGGFSVPQRLQLTGLPKIAGAEGIGFVDSGIVMLATIIAAPIMPVTDE